MTRILIENGATEITPEEAMRWYCWHEIVEPMEEQGKETLDVAIHETGRNIPDWEMQVLKKYLEIAEHDLIIGKF